MDITVILIVILVCFLAIMGSHVFFIYEHKSIYEKLEEIEKKIEELKGANSNI